jgi:hypothetical protein
LDVFAGWVAVDSVSTGRSGDEDETQSALVALSTGFTLESDETGCATAFEASSGLTRGGDFLGGSTGAQALANGFNFLGDLSGNLEPYLLSGTEEVDAGSMNLVAFPDTGVRAEDLGTSGDGAGAGALGAGEFAGLEDFKPASEEDEGFAFGKAGLTAEAEEGIGAFKAPDEGDGFALEKASLPAALTAEGEECVESSMTLLDGDAATDFSTEAPRVVWATPLVSSDDEACLDPPRPLTDDGESGLVTEAGWSTGFLASADEA